MMLYLPTTTILKKSKTYSVLSGDMSNKMHHFPTDDVVGGKDWRG